MEWEDDESDFDDDGSAISGKFALCQFRASGCKRLSSKPLEKMHRSLNKELLSFLLWLLLDKYFLYLFRIIINAIAIITNDDN